MADSKISALTAITTLTPATDVLPVVDVTGTTKKITTNQILGSGGTATLASATITGDLTVRTNRLATTTTGVGIGTATPAAALDVQGSSLRLQVQSSSNGSYATWKYIGKNSTGTAVNFEQGLNIAADNAFELYDNQNTQLVSRYVSGVSGAHSWFLTGTTAMTLNSTGLGIGASPTQKLHVKGVVNFEQVSGGTNGWQVYTYTDGTYRMNYNGAGADELIIDTSGNVGIGVTPSAWDSGFQVIENSGGSLWSGSTGAVRLSQNSYYATSLKYKNALAASQYVQTSGQHQWFYDSGTRVVGTACNFVQAMTLDASGNLGIGITNPSNRLHALVSSGADRDIFAAQVLAASNGFQVKWNHATTTLRVILANIPTSSAGLASGTLWNDAGTIKIA